MNVISTAGCIAVPEEHLKSIIEWLDPRKNTIIIMGNDIDLQKGFEFK